MGPTERKCEANFQKSLLMRLELQLTVTSMQTGTELLRSKVHKPHTAPATPPVDTEYWCFCEQLS